MLSPMMRYVQLVMLILAAAIPAAADMIFVENHSFEQPTTQYVDVVIPGWNEIDLDSYSQNTGVFLNLPGISYVVNAEGNQVAFLIAQEGNAFQQELSHVYQVDKSYKLTMGIGVSINSPLGDPNDPLELAFYYHNDETLENVDVAVVSVTSERRSSTYLDEMTVNLPTVQSVYSWAGQPIGIAFRGKGVGGGAWIIDNVRVTEYPLVPNFTDDTIVNLADFSKMASEWLSCGQKVTDVTGEGCVNEADLLILAEYWLENI